MRDELLEFELGLELQISEEIREREWGRAFVCPSLPLVWDRSWMLIEQPGLAAAEVIAVADEALASFQHRTVAIRSEEDGARLAREFEAVPGWEVETNVYMVWHGMPSSPPAVETRETSLAGCEGLRRELIFSGLEEAGSSREAATEQLLEMSRRFGGPAGDRWFVAPSQEPASACCLLSGDGIGQVESVGTLPAARGQGLAQAVILAATSASRQAGHRITFIVADAEDWPRLMHEKLGFETCGALQVLRRTSHEG